MCRPPLTADVGAGDIGRSVGREEGDGVGDFFRRGESPGGNGRANALLYFFAHRLHHFRAGVRRVRRS